MRAAAGADGPAELAHAEAVMGTVASFLVVPGTVPSVNVQDAIRSACEVLHHVDRVFSTWQPASPLSRFRRGEVALHDLPDEVAEVAERCESAKATSRGWFDPWRLPGGFDPTGLVKGWAVERAAVRAAASGARGGMVNVGGDLVAWGEPADGGRWTVALRHPVHRDAAAGVLAVDRAVATSGEYERGAHLWDPFAGRPRCRVASATVAGPDLAMADALATALAVAGTPGLSFVADAGGYEGLVILPDGQGRATPGFGALLVGP